MRKPIKRVILVLILFILLIGSIFIYNLQSNIHSGSDIRVSYFSSKNIGYSVFSLFKKPVPSCRDSDSNATFPTGINYYQQGLADNRVNGIGSYYEDRCLLKNQTGPRSWQYVKVPECFGANCNLQEGYCSGNSVSNIAYKCPYGCEEGQCMGLIDRVKKLPLIEEMYHYYPSAVLKVMYVLNLSEYDRLHEEIVQGCPDMNVRKEYYAIGFFDSNSSEYEDDPLSYFWVDSHNISEIHCHYGFYPYLSECKAESGTLCKESTSWCGNQSILISGQNIRSQHYTCCSGGCKTVGDYNCNNIIKKQVYSGDSKNKVDILLFPVNFQNNSQWEEDVKSFIDVNSSDLGFFSFEPMKSNKGKFNVWYSGILPELKLAGSSEGDFVLNEEAFKIVQLISERCVGEYEVASLVVNNEQTGISLHGGNAGQKVFSIEKFTRDSNGVYKLNKYAFTHEFGHAFANLGDEYENGGSTVDFSYRPNIDSEGCPKWCSGVLNQSVYYGPSSTNVYSDYINFKQCLYNVTQNLTVQYVYGSCNYPGHVTEVDLGTGCLEGTGCYWNARGVVNFRSSSESIMRYNASAGFNIISQKAINDKIMDIAGDSNFNDLLMMSEI